MGLVEGLDLDLVDLEVGGDLTGEQVGLVLGVAGDDGDAALAGPLGGLLEGRFVAGDLGAERLDGGGGGAERLLAGAPLLLLGGELLGELALQEAAALGV
jgi:hypothetical protein